MPPLILPRYLAPGRDEALSERSQAMPARVQRAETLRKRGINVYRCPVCRKVFRHDDEYEPVCTGPDETRDDHPMTVMTFLRTEAPKRQW